MLDIYYYLYINRIRCTFGTGRASCYRISIQAYEARLDACILVVLKRFTRTRYRYE